ncbi:hypothetical protein Goarm_022765, partial [Gossypium armourianum]|nr:hypothetical protein [Gossypium armourianum]
DEEEDAFCEDALVVDNEYKYCLAGLCLIDSTVHFLSLRNTMAELWHPIGGIFISDLGERRCLLRFFHDIDINRIQPGEDPILVPLSTSEFWIQIHDLPTGMMTEVMAKKFGNFLWQFVEYDASIPTIGIQKFMCIRVRLDVTMSLKRKKKILIGKERVVYARAVAKRRNSSITKWLREADGSISKQLEKESGFAGNNFGMERDTGHDWRRDVEKSYTNLNFMPLGYGKEAYFKGYDNIHNMKNRRILGEVSKNGPMELILVSKNEPFETVERKKRKRMVGGGNVRSVKVMEENTQAQSASSAGRSSRMQ